MTTYLYLIYIWNNIFSLVVQKHFDKKFKGFYGNLGHNLIIVTERNGLIFLLRVHQLKKSSKRTSCNPVFRTEIVGLHSSQGSSRIDDRWLTIHVDSEMLTIDSLHVDCQAAQDRHWWWPLHTNKWLPFHVDWDWDQHFAVHMKRWSPFFGMKRRMLMHYALCIKDDCLFTWRGNCLCQSWGGLIINISSPPHPDQNVNPPHINTKTLAFDHASGTVSNVKFFDI